MPREMTIAIIIVAILIIAAIINHERDPEKKIHLQEERWVLKQWEHFFKAAKEENERREESEP